MGTTDSELLNYSVDGAQVTEFFAELQALVDAALASVTGLADSFVLLDESTARATTAGSDLDEVIATLDAGFTTLDASLAQNTATFDALSTSIEANITALDDNTLATEQSAAAADVEAEAVKREAAAHDEAGASFDLSKGKLLALVGAAVLVAGAFESVKLAGNFEEGLTQLVTGAGELKSNLALISSGMLKMSVDTATSTTQLQAGLYMIESAGFHGAAGLAVLQAAAEGARVGNAQLGDVANSVTSLLNAYAGQNYTAASATNILIATVASGKMHMQDLAASLGSILPVASKAGISAQEVGAAMATMTMMGTPAADATTYLRQMLINLEAPGAKAVKTLKEVGLSAAQVALDMRKKPDGMVNTLQEISAALAEKFPGDAAIATSEFAKVKAGTESMDVALANLANNTSPAYVAALKDISGGSKNMMAMMELTGPQLETFRQNLKNITDAANKSKEGIAGWTEVQGDFNFKLGQAHAAFDAFLIQVGERVLPILGQFATWITGVGVPLLQQLSDAFLNVISPVQQVATVVAQANTEIQQTFYHITPLTDAFGRHGVAVEKTGTQIKPVTEIVKQHTVAIRDATSRSETLTDAIDAQNAGTAKLGKTTQSVHQTAFNPFAATIKQLADYFTHTVVPIFLTFANAIQKNLLPPLLALAQNTVTLVAHFVSWLNTSGTLKDVVDTLSVVLGTLVGWVAGLIGWLSSGNPFVWVLVGALTAVGVAIAAIKLLDFVTGLGNMIAAAKSGNGFFGDLAATMKDKISTAFDEFTRNQIPNLNKGFHETQDAAAKTKTSVEDIGTQATTTAETVTTETTVMKTDMETVGTQATTTATEVTTIGTEATAASVEVEGASAAMVTDMEAVGTAAEVSAGSTGIGKIGPAAVAAEASTVTETAAMTSSFAAIAGPLGIGLVIAAAPMIMQSFASQFKQMADDFKKKVDDMVQAAKDKKSAMEAALSYQANLQIDITRAQYGLPSSEQETAAPYNNTPPTVTKHHALGGFNLRQGWSSLNELGTEGAFVPSGTNILPHNSFATIMDSIPQLGQAVNSLVSQRSQGGSSSSGGSGITINGDVHLHGVQNVQQLWQALNEYGGSSLEHGLSVGTVGM